MTDVQADWVRQGAFVLALVVGAGCSERDDASAGAGGTASIGSAGAEAAGGGSCRRHEWEVHGYWVGTAGASGAGGQGGATQGAAAGSGGTDNGYIARGSTLPSAPSLAFLGCPTGQRCVFDDGACGTEQQQGRCERPEPCEEAGRICGCDGNWYASECAAAAAGVDVDELERCQLLPGRFACGPLSCAVDRTACWHTISHAFGYLYGFDCLEITAECSATAVSGGDPYCQCVNRSACSLCTAVQVADGAAVYKSCSDY